MRRSRSTRHDVWFADNPKISIPSLLVAGETDRVIEREMSDEVAGLFENGTVLHHGGGHFVPATAQQKKVYLEFLQGRMNDRAN